MFGAVEGEIPWGREHPTVLAPSASGDRVATLMDRHNTRPMVVPTQPEDATLSIRAPLHLRTKVLGPKGTRGPGRSTSNRHLDQRGLPGVPREGCSDFHDLSEPCPD
jgi:hypothetical protein